MSNAMNKIFNNEIVWLNYDPGAGGDFLMGTLFNLPETDTFFKEINRYGSFYFNQTIELPFYTISNVKNTEDVNKVKEYIDNTKLSYISSHTFPKLIYPLLEKPKKLTNVYIYSNSSIIDQYIYVLSGIKNSHNTRLPRWQLRPHKWPRYLKTINDIINRNLLSNESDNTHIECKENIFPISYCSLFIDRTPEVLKKLIDIYSADITVGEFDLKIKEYHNKNLELIKNENDKYTL